jgi:hypothetical protein
VVEQLEMVKKQTSETKHTHYLSVLNNHMHDGQKSNHLDINQTEPTPSLRIFASSEE